MRTARSPSHPLPALLIALLMLAPAFAMTPLAGASVASPGASSSGSDAPVDLDNPARLVQNALSRVLTPDELRLLQLAQTDLATLSDQVSFLEAAARASGAPVRLPYEHEIDPQAPLAIALEDAAARAGGPRGFLNPDIALAASSLPLDLQEALALLLYAATEPGADGIARAALVASALEQGAPTLTKHRLLEEARSLYRNRALAAPGLADPLTLLAFRTETARIEAARLLPAHDRSGGPVSNALLALAAQHGIAPPAPVSPAIGEHDLVAEVLALYAREGVVATPDDLLSLHAQADALPAHVAAGTAALLHAINAASLLEQQALRGLTQADVAFLLENEDEVARIAASTGDVSAADLALLEGWLALLARYDAARMVEAALLVATTTEAVVPVLAGAPAPVRETSFWDALAALSPVGSARAQSAPIPTPQLPTGDNNIVFIDPALRTVIITGSGTTLFDTRYAGGSPILTVDLGGDDVYTNNVGAAVPRIDLAIGISEGGGITLGLPTVGTNPASALTSVAVAIDLGGNDRYEPRKLRANEIPSTQGVGVFGVGLLLDLRGDDTYEAPGQPFESFIGPSTMSASQAFAQLGVGILADLDGNDRYTAPGEYAQGAASLFGIALLLDATTTREEAVPADRDAYKTFHSGQGYADGIFGAFAIGALVDASGDDRYEGGNAVQGSGLGAAGILVDGAGADTYVALDRAQGANMLPYEFQGGYGPQMPVALLVDFGEGADTFRAASYGMGANAGGILLNLGEDADLYESSGNRTQGYAGGILLDRGGNDRYVARGVTDDDTRGSHADSSSERFTYAQGSSGPLHPDTPESAAMVYAVGILADLDGNDHYVSAGGRSQGWNESVPASVNKTAGLLIDRSGDDRYEAGASGDRALALKRQRQGTDSQNYVVDLDGRDAYTNPNRRNDWGFDASTRNSDNRTTGNLTAWDLYLDYVENALGSNPEDPGDHPLSDPDSDGFPTWLERQEGQYGILVRDAVRILNVRDVSALTTPTDPNNPDSNPSRIYVATNCLGTPTYNATLLILVETCARANRYVDNGTFTGFILDLGGNDRYLGGDFALSRGLAMDLAGHDTYVGNNGSLNAVLDYTGNDTYTSTGPRSQNGIVDLAIGDRDSFTAGNASQASFPRYAAPPAASAGASVSAANGTAAFLLNFGTHTGADQYVAGDNSQAAVAPITAPPAAVAAPGYALLFNANGNVTFRAGNHSQAAVNNVSGATALLVTGVALPASPVDYRQLLYEIADSYEGFGGRADSTYLAGYGSQGAVSAVGTLADGGALVVANSFALLFDALGNDTYRAGPYSQASVGWATAHVRRAQVVGSTEETVQNAVAMSAALLVDGVGRDRYESVPVLFPGKPETGVSTSYQILRYDESRTPTGWVQGRGLGYAESAQTTARLNDTGAVASTGGRVRTHDNVAAALDLGNESDLYLALERSLGAARGTRALAAVINVEGDDTYVGGPGSFANTTPHASALFLDGDGVDRYFLANHTPVRDSDVLALAQTVANIPVGPNTTAITDYAFGTAVAYVTDSVVPFAGRVVDGVDETVLTNVSAYLGFIGRNVAALTGGGEGDPFSIWQTVNDVLDLGGEQAFGLRRDHTCSPALSAQDAVRQAEGPVRLAPGAYYFAPPTMTRVCFNTSALPDESHVYVYAWNSTPTPESPEEGALVHANYSADPEGELVGSVTIHRNDTEEFRRWSVEHCSRPDAQQQIRLVRCNLANAAWWTYGGNTLNQSAILVPNATYETRVPLCVSTPGADPICILSYLAVGTGLDTNPPVPSPPSDHPEGELPPPNPNNVVRANPGDVNAYKADAPRQVQRFLSALEGPGNNRIWTNTGQFDDSEQRLHGLALGVDSPVRFATSRVASLSADGTGLGLFYVRLGDMAPVTTELGEVRDSSGRTQSPYRGTLRMQVNVTYADAAPLFVHRVEVLADSPVEPGVHTPVAANVTTDPVAFLAPRSTFNLEWDTTAVKPGEWVWDHAKAAWTRAPVANETYAWDNTTGAYIERPETGKEWTALDGSYTLRARGFSLIRYAYDGSNPGDPVLGDGVGAADDEGAWGKLSAPRTIEIANPPRLLATRILAPNGTDAPRCTLNATTGARAACFSPVAGGEPGRGGVHAVAVQGLLSRIPTPSEGVHTVVVDESDVLVDSFNLVAKPAPVARGAEARTLGALTFTWNGTRFTGTAAPHGAYAVEYYVEGLLQPHDAGDGAIALTDAVAIDRSLPRTNLTGPTVSNSETFLLSWITNATGDIDPVKVIVEYQEFDLTTGEAITTGWTDACARRDAGFALTTVSLACEGANARIPAGGDASSMRITGELNRTYLFRSIARDAAGNWERKDAPDLQVVVDYISPASTLEALPAAIPTSAPTLRWTASDAGTGIKDVILEQCDATASLCDPATPSQWTRVGAYGPATTSAVAAGLEDGHRYRFRTLARDLAGNVEALGRKAESIETTVDLQAPLVEDLGARDITYRAATIAFKTAEPTTGAVVLTALDGPMAGNVTRVNLTGALRSEHVVVAPNLLPGTRYRVEALVSDAAGNPTPALGGAVAEFATLHLLQAAFQYPTENARLADVITLRWSGTHVEGANVTYRLSFVNASGEPLHNRTEPLVTVNGTATPTGVYLSADVDTFLLGGDCHLCRVRLEAETHEERLVLLSAPVDVDNLPPTVRVDTGNSTENAAGWFNAPLEVRLVAEDAGAGVKAVHYTTRGANLYDPVSRDTYREPIALGDGIHLLRYYAEDNVGRESALAERTLRVDTTPPSLSSVTAGLARVSTREVLLRVEATDAGSGVQDMRIRVAGGAWSDWSDYRPSLVVPLPGGDGLKSIEVEVRDVAGNPSARRLTSVTLDTTPPSLVDVSVTPGVASATLRWVADEPTRGEVRLVDGASGERLRFPVTTLSERHTLTLPNLRQGERYTAEIVLVDEVGHQGALGEAAFTLDEDLAAPDAVPDLAARIQGGRAILTWSPAADNVGVLKYRVSRAPVTTAGDAARVTLAETPAHSFIDLNAPAATHYYFVAAIDAAGNVGPESRVAVDSPGGAGFESASITPERAMSTDRVTFEATFRDDGRGTPLGVVLVVGEDRYWMTPAGTVEGGALRYRHDLVLPGLSLGATRHRYHVEAIYDNASYRYPAIGEMPGPLVLDAAAAGVAGAEDSASFFAKVREIPAPGLLASFAAFIATGLCVAYVARRMLRRNAP